MRVSLAARLTVLAIGLAAIVFARWVFIQVGWPEMLAQMVRDVDDPNMVVFRLSNQRGGAKRLDLAGLEYFLYPPADNPDIAVAQVHARPVYLGDRDRADRAAHSRVVEPGEVIDIKDISPLFTDLPPKAKRLYLVFSSYPPYEADPYWRGFIRSPFINLNWR